MPDKIFPNDSENRNNWLGNGNSGMDAVAQANPHVYTQLSSGHGKQFEKRAWKFEHSSIRFHGRNESAQLNTTGILHANMKEDDFTSEISLIETRMGSSSLGSLLRTQNTVENSNVTAACPYPALRLDKLYAALIRCLVLWTVTKQFLVFLF